jgi:hypothetical protein
VSSGATSSKVALEITLRPSEKKTKSAQRAVACEVGGTLYRIKNPVSLQCLIRSNPWRSPACLDDLDQ